MLCTAHCSQFYTEAADLADLLGHLAEHKRVVSWILPSTVNITGIKMAANIKETAAGMANSRALRVVRVGAGWSFSILGSRATAGTPQTQHPGRPVTIS